MWYNAIVVDSNEYKRIYELHYVIYVININFYLIHQNIHEALAGNVA